MTSEFENIVIVFIVFAAAVIAVLIIAKYNYLIRKAMIEKGSEIGRSKITFMDAACIVFGIGIGLGICALVSLVELEEVTMDLLISSIIIVSGGMGLVAAHLVRQNAEGGK